MSEIKLVYQARVKGGYWSNCPEDNPNIIEEVQKESWMEVRILYPSAAYEALQENCAKLLDEQDREYNRKTNELINRHADQVEALQKENAFVINDLHIARSNIGTLKAESAAQTKRIAELEAIDERQLEEILFAVTDGLATHNLRFVMLDAINHILKRSASKNGE